MIQLFSQQIVDEMNGDNPRLLHAIEIKYKNATIRTHTGVGEIIINGQVYIGVGTFGAIDPVSQSSNTAPSSVGLSLSGMDPTLVAETLNEKSQGSPVKIMVCSLDENEKVTSSSIIFAGKVNDQKFKYGKVMAIALDVVDRLEDWQRKGSLRFDPSSHKTRFPNDDIFQYMSRMSEAPLYWGSKKDSPGFNYKG
ncbi:TPA: hypothetical protein ACX6NV_000597 [Photobacterium damselae]